MQGIVLQLTRVGFLLLLWLFIWSVLRILRTDIYAPTGAVMVRRGLALRARCYPTGAAATCAPAGRYRRRWPVPASRWAVSRC
jgi:hypothetical protein